MVLFPGRGGKTKEKIARVSGAAVQLPAHSMILEITGTRDQRRKAKKYVECIMARSHPSLMVGLTFFFI